MATNSKIVWILGFLFLAASIAIFIYNLSDSVQAQIPFDFEVGQPSQLIVMDGPKYGLPANHAVVYCASQDKLIIASLRFDESKITEVDSTFYTLQTLASFYYEIS